MSIHDINVDAVSPRDGFEISLKVDEVSAEYARLNSLAHGLKPIALSVFSQHGHKHAVCVVSMGVKLDCLATFRQTAIHELAIQLGS